MARQQRWVGAAPADVWAVLADGWSYAGFVVGSTHVRAVDPHWPAPGARLLPTVGAWPLQREGETRCEESEAPHRLVVTARGWPLGEARVVFTLEPRDGGTLVSLSEDAVAGPGALVPRPLRGVAIGARNRETLARLEALALRRPA